MKKKKAAKRKKKPAVEPKCYHSNYDFEVLSGPFTQVRSVDYPLGSVDVDMRDVMYLHVSHTSGKYRFCDHTWGYADIQLLLRYVNKTITCRIDKSRARAFQQHWQTYHNEAE